jgi:hypothetical protein
LKPGTKGNILFAVVVGASLLAIYLFGFPMNVPSMSFELKPDATGIEGEVLSVETVNRGGGPPRKEAVIRLSSGETVRADAGACVVFPGQSAKLWHYPIVGYVVSESASPPETPDQPDATRR